MNKRNYQKEMEDLIKELQKEEKVPSLLLHSCCAPCSSYVLEYLSDYFRITVLYYNPNIFPESEYKYRIEEQRRLKYTPDDFYSRIKGLEKEKEGGRRCEKCFRLRLEYAAKLAEEKGFDFFTTTLSISPLKNAPLLNSIGTELAEIYHVPYLVSDFKKKNGYKRSVELSAEYELYRQNYCGCVYSEAERRENMQR